MDKTFTLNEWLNRAKSNFLIGKISNPNEEIYLEDLCFELQQCVEKSFKAVLLSNGIDFSRTHDIAFLVTLIKNRTNLEIPKNIETAKKLTSFAVQTRYPCWDSIEPNDYLEAVQIAEDVYNWAKNVISNK